MRIKSVIRKKALITASGSEGTPFSWQRWLCCTTRPGPWWKEPLSPRAPIWEVPRLLCPVWPHTGGSSLGSSLLRPAILFPERWSVLLFNSGGRSGLVSYPDSPHPICFLHWSLSPLLMNHSGDVPCFWLLGRCRSSLWVTLETPLQNPK